MSADALLQKKTVLGVGTYTMTNSVSRSEFRYLEKSGGQEALAGRVHPLMAALPRQFKLLALLFVIVSGPLAWQVFCGSDRCCCAGVELRASVGECQCNDSHGASDCGLQCAPERHQAFLEYGTVLAYREQPAYIVIVPVLGLVLKTAPPKRVAPAAWTSRWVLPSSPPLLASHIALPPPA